MGLHNGTYQFVCVIRTYQYLFYVHIRFWLATLSLEVSY